MKSYWWCWAPIDLAIQSCRTVKLDYEWRARHMAVCKRSWGRHHHLQNWSCPRCNCIATTTRGDDAGGIANCSNGRVKQRQISAAPLGPPPPLPPLPPLPLPSLPVPRLPQSPSASPAMMAVCCRRANMEMLRIIISRGPAVEIAIRWRHYVPDTK